MNDLDDSFNKLLGKQATDEDKQQLYATAEALGIRNNDALWLILMALQHHQTLYNEIPERIHQVAKITLDNIKQTADAATIASAAKAQEALIKAVAAASDQIASDTAKKEKIKWMAGCIVVSALCFSVLTLKVHSIAHESGYQFGYGLAYQAAKDEKAAANWANTHQGKAAFQLALNGELDSLVHCSKKGWSIEKGVCFPKTANDGLVYGFKIP